MEKLETQEKESRPLGQRYDQARKRLNQATKTSDDSLQALKDARVNRETCLSDLAEAQKAFDEVAAQRQNPEQEEDLGSMPLQEYEMFSNLLDAVDATWLPTTAGGHADPPERLLSAMQQCREKIQSVSQTRSPQRRGHGAEECKGESDIDIDSTDEEEEDDRQRTDTDERWGQTGYAASVTFAPGPTAAAHGQRRMRAMAQEKTEAACPAETPPRKKPKSEDERKEKKDRRAKAEALLAEVEQIAPGATPDYWDKLAAGSEADPAPATVPDGDTVAASATQANRQAQQSYARVLAKHMRKESPY
jgi:hypothetical protein